MLIRQSEYNFPKENLGAYECQWGARGLHHYLSSFTSTIYSTVEDGSVRLAANVVHPSFRSHRQTAQQTVCLVNQAGANGAPDWSV